MPDELNTLIDLARKVTMTRSDRESQRRSFAFGNTQIENPRITRETVGMEAEKLTADGRPKRKAD